MVFDFSTNHLYRETLENKKWIFNACKQIANAHNLDIKKYAKYKSIYH